MPVHSCSLVFLYTEVKKRAPYTYLLEMSTRIIPRCHRLASKAAGRQVKLPGVVGNGGKVIGKKLDTGSWQREMQRFVVCCTHFQADVDPLNIHHKSG